MKVDISLDTFIKKKWILIYFFKKGNLYLFEMIWFACTVNSELLPLIEGKTLLTWDEKSPILFYQSTLILYFVLVNFFVFNLLELNNYPLNFEPLMRTMV